MEQKGISWWLGLLKSCCPAPLTFFSNFFPLYIMAEEDSKRPADEEEQQQQQSAKRIKVGDTRSVDVHLVPQAPKIPKTAAEKEKTRRLIVVLEQATLETLKVGKKKEGNYQLLNVDDHLHILKKTGRETYEARPDILHQVTNILMSHCCEPNCAIDHAL